MQHRFAHLATRLFNTPIAVHPDKAALIVAVLADRLGLARLFHADGRALALDAGGARAFVDDSEFARPSRAAGYDILAGVAVIPVVGTLVQKLGTLRPYSGMTGYDGIRTNFLAALEDPQAEAIALCIDSPGGECAGCFDLVDTIYAARGVKPIWAILDEVAYSAAYAIASAADTITVPRTGGTGSVGVVLMHVEWSRALEASGVTVSFIQYGARKTDGADVKPLDPAAAARFQADIDAMGELFVATVARNRGLGVAAIRDQEATTFLGSAGVAAGLADDVLAPDEAFRALIDQL
jgi:ClpP class serine protease